MSRAVIRAALFAFATGGAITAGEGRPPAQARVTAPRPLNVVLLVDRRRAVGLDGCGRQQDRADTAARSARRGWRAVYRGACHDIDLHGQPGHAADRPVHVASRHRGVRPADSAPDAFANTFPAVLRRAGYWTGYVGKYGVGAARTDDFDFLRPYEGVHWMTGTARRTRPRDREERPRLDRLPANPPEGQAFLARPSASSRRTPRTTRRSSTSRRTGARRFTTA